jgi:ATP-dependent helicase/nuclease subunit B
MSLPVPFQPELPFDAEPEPAPAREPRLVETLARICREHPLESKILVAPSLAIGHGIAERLARGGTPWINLRVETVRTLAHALVGPDLAREGLRLLSRAQALALVEQACAEVLGPDSYFGELADRPGLHRALQSTLDELRAAGLDPARLPAAAFSDRQKHRELQDVFRRHAALLDQARCVDANAVLRRAVRALETGRPAEDGSTYLVCAPAELSALERQFLEKLSAGRSLAVEDDPPDAWAEVARGARLFRATGEENEIREVFRRIQLEKIPFDDVELLHTDPAVYPALAWELSREHEVPCTFSGGIAVGFTRPGRAALAFLDWIGQGFAADVLREALASGALTLERLDGAPAAGAGSLAVARILRRARLGWGRQRHLQVLDRFVAELERPPARSREEADEDPAEVSRRADARARDLEAASRAQRFLERALALAPASLEGTCDLPGLARGARTFVAELARSGDDLDGTARTALDVLFREFEELASLPISVASAVERLRDAVAGLAVGADRPRPGRLHVAFFAQGGFSGRRRTFLLGLDEGRHPGPDLEDPILLDTERRRINEDLPAPVLTLLRDRPRETASALRACVARLRGRVWAGYSCFDLRNLSQAGEPAPSPFFLELYRAQSGLAAADYRDLFRALPPASGFVPTAEAALDGTEWWLAQVAAAPDRPQAGRWVRAAYPWLANGDRAEQARESDEFTPWDGWIRSGTPELDPRRNGKPVSASRIQELAKCPFAYFVRDVLRIRPPEDPERDPAVWLDPRSRGSLLHEVFKDFFEEITAAGQRPEVARHQARLEALAQERIARWRERVAPPSELAFALQRDDILFACRTLLAHEEEHCRDIVPRFFEVPFGMAREARQSRAGVASQDPVDIPAGRGARLQLRGSIDRVDEAADGTFHVWDYKTGSAWGIAEGRGLRGGRQVQPALYAQAFEALLARAGRPGKVSRSGYFLPGRRGEGQRIVLPFDPSETGDVLRRLCDLVAAGMFPHALSENDCTNCDFESICGGAEKASRRAERKIEKSVDAVLAAFREIHARES